MIRRKKQVEGFVPYFYKKYWQKSTAIQEHS